MKGEPEASLRRVFLEPPSAPGFELFESTTAAPSVRNSTPIERASDRLVEALEEELSFLEVKGLNPCSGTLSGVDDLSIEWVANLVWTARVAAEPTADLKRLVALSKFAFERDWLRVLAFPGL